MVIKVLAFGCRIRGHDAQFNLLDREDELVLQMSAMPASHRWAVSDKIDVLEHYLEPAAEETKRTFLLPLLASIKADYLEWTR